MRRVSTLWILALLILPAGTLSAQSDFVRGDCNIDGAVDIGDPVALLGILFSGAPASTCADACDSNDDGMTDIGDPIYTLGYLFTGGATPPVPFPACGADPTADALDCIDFPLCVTAVEICDNGADDDGDGFIDCDDFDCVGDPACPEICDNGIDDDGDTFIDCDDADCVGDAACPEICDNGIDDDGDTFIDCDDFDCDGDPACAEICDNGIDDDGDTFIDCNDFDCTADPACIEICDNGVDDDGDGFVDCDDFGCNDDPACLEICDNGIDDDGNGFVDCDDFDCLGSPLCPEICDNAADDDGDGFVDCEDTDCAGDPACPENCNNAIDDDGDGFVDCDDFDCLASPFCFKGAPPIMINEVDYDQVGSDANEYIEIYNAGAFDVPLAEISLVLVNGSNSTDYQIIPLSLAGPSLAGGQYLVVHSGTVTIAPGALSIVFDNATNNVQNGGPDGIALVNLAADFVYDALSYEGSITAATITGVNSLVNLVEGTATAAADDNATAGLVLIRSPNGADTNDASVDWTTSTTPTPGAANP